MRAATRSVAVATCAAIALLPQPEALAESFAVMTYNVRGIPFPAIEDRTSEMEQIAGRLQDFHTAAPPYVGIASFVALQEVFSPVYYAILTDPETVSYPYVTEKNDGGTTGVGDGLTMLSDFDIDDYMRTDWDDCFGTLNQFGSDCDTDKGYSFAHVELEPGVFVDVYTLHADAGQDPGSRSARRSNIGQLVEAINILSPEGRPVLVLGDTNGLYTRFPDDNVQDLLAGAGLTDVWVRLRRGGVVPGAGEDIDADCETTPSTANCELVDKVLYRDGGSLLLEPVSYTVLRAMFSGSGEPLSDHDPVAVTFDYTVQTTTTTTTTLSTSTSTSTSTTTTLPADRPCGDPLPPDSVSAGDALFVLKAAVGAFACQPCTCDANESGGVNATDALLVLKAAVGQNVTLHCPACDTTSTTLP